MNLTFHFEIDFDTSEVTVLADHKRIAVATMNDDDGVMTIAKVKSDFEDRKKELLEICKTLYEIADNL
jgi:hypothetical protein